MRWNKRPQAERNRIVQNTLRRLQRKASRIAGAPGGDLAMLAHDTNQPALRGMQMPDTKLVDMVDNFYSEATQLAQRLRSAGTNATREKLGRLVAAVDTALETARQNALLSRESFVKSNARIEVGCQVSYAHVVGTGVNRITGVVIDVCEPRYRYIVRENSTGDEFVVNGTKLHSRLYAHVPGALSLARTSQPHAPRSTQRVAQNELTFEVCSVGTARIAVFADGDILQAPVGMQQDAFLEYVYHRKSHPACKTGDRARQRARHTT